MAPKAHASLLLLLLLVSSVVAYDIIEILQPFQEYSTFANYLTKTKVADEINRRQTITVLVVDNSAISPLASLSPDNLKKVISLHVLLDYYDPYKLDKLSNKTALITTLFQASGLATNNMGFLNYTEMPGERMVFGPATPGAPLNANLDKVVAARPYNISVLQVSTPILPQGIENAASAPPTLPAAGAAPKAAPIGAPTKKESPVTPTAAPEGSAAAPEGSAAAPKTPKGSAAAPEGGAAAPTEGSTDDAEHAPATAPAKSTADEHKHSSANRRVVSVSIGLAMGVVALAAL